MPMVERSDATVREQWDTDAHTYTMWINGGLALSRPFNANEEASVVLALQDLRRATNTTTLRTAGRNALAGDRAYLDAVAAGTATQQMAIAQVAALTRQIMGMGRLLIAGDLLDTVDAP